MVRRMLRSRLIFLFAVFFIGAGISHAQPEFTVDAPAVVASDEVFNAVYTATAEKDAFSGFVPPQFPDFEVLAGPMSSTMMSTNIFNGKRTTVRQRSYTYTLRPLKEGKFILPAASIMIDGRKYETPETVVEVVKASGKGTSSGRTDARASAGADLVLKMDVSKTEVAVGEPVMATIKLYCQNSAISGLEDVRFPSFNGFWSQETDTPQNISFKRENYGGKVYNSALLRKFMLFPQQSGEIVIDPAEIVCLIQVRDNSPATSFFDDFFDTYQTVRKRVASEAVTVRVKPLPGGAPASFTGGVGKFDMKVALSTDSLKAHEASSLTVTVSGDGNFNMLEAPDVTLPPEFESYDVKKTDGYKAGPDGFTGKKVFEYPFIPRSYGSFTLPGVEFSYYDVSAGRYRTLKAPQMKVEVAKGNAAGPTVVQPGINKQGVKTIGEDIRYIAVDGSGLKPAGRSIAESPFMYIVPVAIAVLSAAVAFVIERRRKLLGNAAAIRNRRARKAARFRLRNADAFLREGRPADFYRELHRAVYGYIADKLMLPVSDLSRDRITMELRSAGVGDRTAGDLLSLLDTCEQAIYSPENQWGDAKSAYTLAENVISHIENTI